MRKFVFLVGMALAAVFMSAPTVCEAQTDSLQYQLVIRNNDGQLVTNKRVNMRFSLMSNGKTFYKETKLTTTDNYGNINVMIGTGTALEGSMKDVPWSAMDISLKVDADTDGGDKFVELGTVPFTAAPYAMYAATAGSNANNGSPKDDEALFEVCDRDGKPVFAVYNDGIVVYVDENADTDKAKRSGLIITGRKATKEDGSGNDYFTVTTEGTHIYVNDADEKAKRSGLIITGRPARKDGETTENEYLTVTAEGTKVIVDPAGDDDKAKRSGLIITGRPAHKDGEEAKFFTVDGNSTHVYIPDNTPDKAKRSGLIITGRPARKDGETVENDYFTVTADGTNVIVDPDDSDKAKRSGLIITGRKATKAGSDMFTVDGNLTHVYIDDDSKAKRSGLIITGRKATKGRNKYIDIDADRTNLNSALMTVTDPRDSVFAMQMRNDRLWFNSDIALDGELRQTRPLLEEDRFTVYMSDVCSVEGEYVWDLVRDFYEEMGEDAAAEFQEKYNYIKLDALDYDYSEAYRNPWCFSANYPYYYDENDDYHGHQDEFSRLASIVDTTAGLVLPCRSNGVILFDKDNKETSILENAVAMVKLDRYYDDDYWATNIYVYPLKPLVDHVLTFALINQPYIGQPSKYERYDVTLNSGKAFEGFKVNMLVAYNSGFKFKGTITTTANGKVEKDFDDEEYYVSDRELSTKTFYGDTVVLEAVTAPAGLVFDYWMKVSDDDDWTVQNEGGIIYGSNPLKFVATELKSYFVAYFKDIPPIWVDGQYGNDETGDGDITPFKTIARALQYIEQIGDGSEYRIATRNYDGDIAVGTNINETKAASIIIDLGQNHQDNGGSTTAQHVIDITTTVPITISNGTISRISTDRAINVATGSTLILDNCTVKGSDDSETPAEIGGAYVAESGKLRLKSSTIMNFSAQNGGGVYLDGGELYLEGTYDNYSIISNCKTTGTSSTNGMGGGVFATNGGKVTFIEYGYVQDNDAKNGGGIYLTNDATIEFIEEYYSYITGNHASSKGGGLFIDEGISLTLDNYNYITSNSAQYGGGVYVSQDASLDQAGAFINSNTASKNGGGVYVAGSLSISNNSTIGDYFRENLGNTCVTGAGVYVDENAIFNMSGGRINYNHSDKSNSSGAGVYVASDGQFIMTAGEIYSNNAASDGGVYLEEEALFTTECSVDGSTATNTIAVYVTEGATFNIKGNAYFGSGSSAKTIYLVGDAMINVTGNLTYQYSTVVATIKLETDNYQKNKQVVTSDGLSSNYSKIAVEKQIVTNTFGASMPVEWTIDNDGKLQKKAVESGTIVDGALVGLFKVSDNKIIRFSQGNLQYLANDGNGVSKWQFAEKQTDAISDADNQRISKTSEYWINLFCYGTSGWNSGALEYQPYIWQDETQANYLQTSMTGQYANADWGVYNAISNGGNTHGMWRTLTTEEWNYLFFERGSTEAESKMRFAQVTITISNNNVRGVVILPDNWTLTNKDLSAAGIHNLLTGNQGNGLETGYAVNVLTSDQWEFMERNGAVFLPADGYRFVSLQNGVYISNSAQSGSYWTADGGCVSFYNSVLTVNDNYDKTYGRSVRLVTDVSDATIDGSASKHEYVDLGLPSGKKWAKINLGFDEIYKLQNSSELNESDAYRYPASYVKGSTQFAHGYRYAWGETEAKSSFDFSTYKYKGASYNTYTKYNAEDGLNVLELEDDPAYLAWGGNWRTPTDEDWKELFENCYWAVDKADNTYSSWVVYKPKAASDKNRHYNGYNNYGCYVPEGWSYQNCGNTTGSSGAAYKTSYSYGAYTVNNIVLPVYTGYMYNGYSLYYTSVLNVTNPYCMRLGTGVYSYTSARNSDNARYYGYYIRPIWVPNTSTVFYVSDEGDDVNNDGTRAKPFKTIQQAASKMTDKYTRYTIFVDGELSDAQTLTGTIKARQITLRGANGLNNSTDLPNDKIIGGITINATYNAANGNAWPLPVVVENLEINNGTGVAVTVGENSKVTYASGAVVSKTEVNGTFTLKNDASAENVVLGAGKTITVDGSFNGTQVNVSLDGDYEEDRPVLTKQGETLPLDLFDLTQPDGAATPWIINSDGKLHHLIGANAPGDSWAVGYVVFADGSASPYNELTDEQKAQAVAVIFSTYEGNYGVSLDEVEKEWAVTSAAGYTDSNLDIYCKQLGSSQNDLEGYTDYAEDNYPAMWWARHYSYNDVDGWWLPDGNELLALLQSFATVNTALSALDKDILSEAETGYWTSWWRRTSYVQYIARTHVSGDIITSGDGAYMENTKRVRAVRKF